MRGPSGLLAAVLRNKPDAPVPLACISLFCFFLWLRVMLRPEREELFQAASLPPLIDTFIMHWVNTRAAL